MKKQNLKSTETNDIDLGMPVYCHLEDIDNMFNEIVNIIRIIKREHKIIKKIYNRYFKFYKLLHYSSTNPRKLIILQSKINEEINVTNIRMKKMKELKNDNNFKRIIPKYFKKGILNIIDDYEYIKPLFFSLMYDMIIKYICDNQCVMYCHFGGDFRKNNVYDYNKIKNYIKKIKEKYKKEKGYYFVCDMCTIELDCGDYIYRIADNINYIEIKDYKYKEREEIIHAAYQGKKIDFKNKDEEEEFNRILKQKAKHLRIDENLSLPPVLSGHYPTYLINKRGFENFIKKDIQSVKDKLYIERIVDDCIKYIIINNKKNIETTKEKIELEKKCSEYSMDGETCFSYDEFLTYSNISRPYMLAWDFDTYKKIVLTEISIYFVLNVEELVNKLRAKGITIYKKKISDQTVNNYKIVRNKGKNYVIKYRNEEHYLTRLFLHRIPNLFYTSDDTVEFYYKVYLEYKQLYDEIEKEKTEEIE